MEVKPGYQQTEVGVIPDDWALAPLVALIDESRSIRYGIVQPGKFDPAGRFMVRGQDYSTGWVAPSELFRVSPQVEEPFKNARVKTGDVVITIVGASTGHIEVIPDWLDGANLTQTTARLAINPAKAFSGFCKCYLQSAAGQRQVANYLKGAAQPGLNCGDIEKFRIPLPPTLPEQRAIATALSDLDGLLGGLDRLIAKKRDLKQAAMQQLLTGQTRLPGFHAEWEVKTLFELAAQKKELFDDGDWIESEHITTEGIRLIQTGNIGVGSFVEKDDKKYINEASFASLRCKQLKQGDLLVCRLADPAGRACVLGEIGEERIVTSVDVTIFRPPSELADRLFLSQVFSTSDWFRAVSDRSGGTTHKRISRGALGRLSINLPPLAEQTAIATVLSEMDGELAELDQRREKTRALKQAMMQELLTGRIRLIGKN